MVLNFEFSIQYFIRMCITRLLLLTTALYALSCWTDFVEKILRAEAISFTDAEEYTIFSSIATAPKWGCVASYLPIMRHFRLRPSLNALSAFRAIYFAVLHPHLQRIHDSNLHVLVGRVFIMSPCPACVYAGYVLYSPTWGFLNWVHTKWLSLALPLSSLNHQCPFFLHPPLCPDLYLSISLCTAILWLINMHI